MRWLRRLYRAGAVVLGLLGLAVIIAFLLPVSVTVTPLQPRADTRYWHMEGGYRIAYTLLTPPLGVAERVPVIYAERVPVIFLHGGPGGYVHSSIIRALQPLADAGHRVYLYDQHGSGLSDRLDQSISTISMARACLTASTVRKVAVSTIRLTIWKKSSRNNSVHRTSR